MIDEAVTNLQTDERFILWFKVARAKLPTMNNVAAITAVDYRAIFHALVKHIEGCYSLKVNVGPVTGSYTGQFDGKEIWVDLDRNPEEAVFILVHLFGHTVQWNLDEKLRFAGFG